MNLPDILQCPLSLYYLSAALVALPVAQIMRRAGFSVAGAALLLVPFIGLILTAGVLALQRWPALTTKGKKA